ncbi:hypothetical protein [Streptomyces purpureus]|uniref:Uncharacterized protein n=1 Tax=Streptomyces purpureus TaxID=1951 RepID=A0A918H7Q4_9ACTN|nr:hypothetical protein [Streptomyces purpureus]GGT43479.1 hypothetical protein GCM10014713_41490 [Streptomyces purpureus]
MTATTLRTIATLWPALDDALAAPTQHSWPPVELRSYLAAMERLDIDDPTAYNTARRQLERSPDQIGQRPIPLNLGIHDTMRLVEAALHETCDQIAAANQREPITPAPAEWPTRDRIRRNKLANADLHHPHRWHYTGRRPGAVHAALWLCARVEGIGWPGRPLTDVQRAHVASVAAGALHRIEAALDLADGSRELSSAHPCPCGGTIQVHGGAGALPVARCKQCGAIWSERGVVAA